MKKATLLTALLTAFAWQFMSQTTEVTNKNGNVVTPETGDFGLGMNASPFLMYVGNMFNGTFGNTVSTSFVTRNAIYGKYFLSPSKALRAGIGIDTYAGSGVSLRDTTQFGIGGPVYIENKYTESLTSFNLSAGMEFRRGHGRLQGYYGGEFTFSYGPQTVQRTNEYALALDSANLSRNYVTNGRILESKPAAITSFGLRGFVGVEYFLAPKISIGGEFGFGMNYNIQGETQVKREYYGSPTFGGENINYTRTTRNGGMNFFRAQTDNLSGAIRVMFHF